jgi:signal transduction histidine kinase
MLQVSRAVASGDSLDGVLEEIARAATSVIEGAGATSIVLVSAAGGYRLAGSHGLTPGYRDAVVENAHLLDQSATAEAIATGEVVWIENAENSDRIRGWRDLVVSEGFRSLLALPLTATDATVGSLCVYRWLPGAWSEGEIDLLRFFADHAATAVQTAQLLVERSEQVAALERLVRTLQDQTHEHANRLHAVRGLLALGENDEATRFLAELLAAHTVTRSEIAARIGHPTLAGLLLAESAIAAQRGIRLEIDPASDVDALPPTLSDSQLVTVVGNLLDNAFDAVAEMPADRRVVRVGVANDGKTLRIEVRDHGPGLQLPAESLLERGVSTKDGHAGAGLSLVQQVARAAMGRLEVARLDEGTSFVVVIPTVGG